MIQVLNVWTILRIINTEIKNLFTLLTAIAAVG